MKHITSHNISVDFNPWFGTGPDTGGHFRFTKIHIYEELGGKIAFGSMDMETDVHPDALEMIQTERTGTITIADEGDGLIYKIPVFITQISFRGNLVSIQFLCIQDKNFLTKKTTEVLKKDIGSTIQALYPGNIDLRCDSDIQGSPWFYQNKETAYDLLVKLCYSYKKDSIFSLGFEGLMLKETFGQSNSRGNAEPDDIMKIRSDSQFTQASGFKNTYYHNLYKLPLNVWEDKKGEASGKDYTDLEMIVPRVLYKNGNSGIIHKDYYQLLENLTYNMAYQQSEYFSEIIIKDYNTIPGYKIGDVLEYYKQSMTHDNLVWPYKYYLVKSNELFLAIDGSEFVNPEGAKFCWTSRLVGMQEDGKIALGTDNDPRDTEK